MSSFSEIIGVDISKDVFDVVGETIPHRQFANNDEGFAAFRKDVSKDSLVVMEATGLYHARLSQFLYRKGIPTSVVNPLSVKRFMQMKLAKIKTDKSDAKAICEYGQLYEVPLFTAPSSFRQEAMQLFSLRDHYLKNRTAAKNKIHGEEVLGIPSKFVFRSLRRDLKHLNKEIAMMDKKLMQIVLRYYGEQFSLLFSIPGIGIQTALSLIVVTDGFSKFDSAAKLCSYIGITPTIRQSGSSVRGRSRISKIGNKKLRTLLFLCAFTASQSNEACKELYDRLVDQGKSKKLAMIAVSNKLVKQAFAIVKSGRPYQAGFSSSLTVTNLN
ncbi:IS110 family RNA-guided transposase [Ulvibacter antarcticus]|uniref:Transposase n=1 Tax=Ulvibacter antarcticus TaxID=442714 RepID=A0A3L9YQP3_9FLAO|nr:IS110 family transposase [Ulvibacter antarcticus]RMA56812.1 transposase [Ulvibacter antarcticus]